MTERYFRDGQEVEASGFTVSGLDEGLTLGLNVFETVRTYHGRFFRLTAHVQRLLGSAQQMGVTIPSHEALEAEFQAAIAGTDQDLQARMMITMGGTRLLRVSRIDAARVRRPLRVVSRLWEPVSWLDGRVKHGSRAVGEVARRQAGVDEVFWVGTDGCFTEAARSSIVAVVGGCLVTPPIDGRILEGVTRAALLEAALASGLSMQTAPLPASAVLTELYACSTLKELAPVASLDGRPGPGSGPLGAALQTALSALIDAECTAAEG